MSSLHVGSLDVHADVEEDNVDRDSEPGFEDSDVNVDSNSEIKFCLSMMSMENADVGGVITRHQDTHAWCSGHEVLVAWV